MWMICKKKSEKFECKLPLCVAKYLQVAAAKSPCLGANFKCMLHRAVCRTSSSSSAALDVRGRGRVRSRANADRPAPPTPSGPLFAAPLIGTLTRKGRRRSREGRPRHSTLRRAASRRRDERGAAAAHRRHKWRRGSAKNGAVSGRSPASVVLSASQ